MEQSLKSFRDQFLETLWRFLWREWTALGVAGQESSGPLRVVDPEALLLLTCTLGRYDPRLFDEMMDWLTRNGRFLSVQRLKNMLQQEPFGGANVMGAVAEWLLKRESPAKWKSLSVVAHPNACEGLFHLTDGRPLPVQGDGDETFLKHGFLRNDVLVRGYSQEFDAGATPCHFLKLRALFGVNIRSDVLAYLTMAGIGHPREISRELYYSQKAVHDAMTDMAFSGFVQSIRSGRERRFRLTPDAHAFLTRGAALPQWVNWAVMLSAAEAVWRITDELAQAALDPAVESSEIMLRTQPILDRIWKAAWMPMVSMGSDKRRLGALSTFSKVFEVVAA
jgi:DNA-binding MarR family transcriptional regulator